MTTDDVGVVWAVVKLVRGIVALAKGGLDLWRSRASRPPIKRPTGLVRFGRRPPEPLE